MALMPERDLEKRFKGYDDLVASVAAHTAGTRVANVEVSNVDKVRVIFSGHRDELIGLLQRWPAFVGCVAWLTDLDILRAMEKRSFGLALQKEDFLHPDSRSASSAADSSSRSLWRVQLREAYSKLPHPDCHDGDQALNFAKLAHSSVMLQRAYGSGTGPVQSVVCVGLAARGDRDFRANMHHKFIVFGDVLSHTIGDDDESRLESKQFQPRAVWTGSFNFSRNASQSLENAMYMENESVARAYYEEWGAVMSLGEALDWTHEHMVPQQRFDEP